MFSTIPSERCALILIPGLLVYIVSFVTVPRTAISSRSACQEASPASPPPAPKEPPICAIVFTLLPPANILRASPPRVAQAFPVPNPPEATEVDLPSSPLKSSFILLAALCFWFKNGVSYQSVVCIVFALSFFHCWSLVIFLSNSVISTSEGSNISFMSLIASPIPKTEVSILVPSALRFPTISLAFGSLS